MPSDTENPGDATVSGDPVANQTPPSQQNTSGPPPQSGLEKTRPSVLRETRGSERPVSLVSRLSKAAALPRADLLHEHILRDAPRMLWEGSACPSLGGIPLLAILGKGGMGSVYLGVHPRLNSEVAVKVLPPHLAHQDPTLVIRFMREAQIAAQIRSNHLVHVIDVNEEAGINFLVMEYVDGVTGNKLGRQGNEEQSLSEMEALDICVGALSGLQAAHAKDVIHRDIKPGNIIVPFRTTDGGLDYRNAKLMDLGLARVRSDDPEQSGLTETESTMGTPGYMAPEQAVAAKSVDRRADIFSMGATLFALLAGRSPFQRDSRFTTLFATANEPPTHLNEIRPDVSETTCIAVNRCLEKNRDKRFSSAEELLARLRTCQEMLANPQASRVLKSGKTSGPSSVIRPFPPGSAAAPSATKRGPKGRTKVGKQSGKPGNTYLSLIAGGVAVLALIAAVALSGKKNPETTPLPGAAEAEPVAVMKRMGETAVSEPANQKAGPGLPHQAVAYHEETLPKEMALDLGGGVKMEMVLVPAGEFKMGAEDGEANEMPVRKVKISQSFYIGKYDVTVAQFRAFVESTKYETDAEKKNKGYTVKDGKWQEVSGTTWRNPGFKQEDNHPACVISYSDAQAFAAWAKKLISRDVRLPSEAQWEYAARGPANCLYPWGDNWDGTLANHADISLKITGYQGAYTGDNDGFAYTSPVGNYKNASWCGAYDMSGNVWQWCHDLYDENSYANSRSDDPVNSGLQGSDRVVRGGSWGNRPANCRSAHRKWGDPDSRSTDGGFRVVVVVGVPSTQNVKTPPPIPPSAAASISPVQATQVRAVSVEDAAKIALTQATLPKEISLDLGAGVKMEMVLVPAGEFMMGSYDFANEQPFHKVKISHSFYIGKFDVTVAQFRAFVNTTKYSTEAEKMNLAWTVKDGKWQVVPGTTWMNPGFKQEDNHPVCVVDWNDAQAFAVWAGKLTNRDVRLPSEAQWEYAARGPENRLYPWGDKWDSTLANHADTSLKLTGFLGDFPGGKDNDGFAYTSPVGNYKNASWCGAFDMAGNVWQWCQDCFNDKYYGESPIVDPQGPASGDYRVLRGGSWSNLSTTCRSARRYFHRPIDPGSNEGFRLAVAVGVPSTLNVKTPPPIPSITPASIPPAQPTQAKVVSVDDAAKIALTHATLPQEMSLDLGSGVKMEMVLVPAGEFIMGDESAGVSDEMPLHKVKFSQSYYIGKYDVTVAQFSAFAEATKFQTEAEKTKLGWGWKDAKWGDAEGLNWRTPGYKQEDNYPASFMSWNDTQEFCKWATTLAERPVRLPTEAEWEYAARGPERRKYPWGGKEDWTRLNHADSSMKNAGIVPRVKATDVNDGYAYASPVGAYKDGASWCGAFDMAGNVWQWCEDWYGENYYRDSPLVDPKGPATGSDRVNRGGSWTNNPGGCRSALRNNRHKPNYRGMDYGFRVFVAAAVNAPKAP